MSGPVLEVEGLTIALESRHGRVLPVRDVSLSVAAGETLGIVGESGCGKTLTALAVMRLLPEPPARIVSGRVRLDGQELLDLGPEEMRAVRGSRISMIFQEPLSSLDPVYSIGAQMRGAIRAHRDLSSDQATELALEMLERVRITRPRDRLRQYPHELSGGMRQRVMIATALALRPKVLLADEPTTALDVTVQAGILRLIRELQDEFHMAVVLISHNLGVIANVADRVIAMYAGQVVEETPVTGLFQRALHPYTLGLLRTLPGPAARGRDLYVIPGRVPNLDEPPRGCAFAARCDYVEDRCRQVEPALVPTESAGRASRCLRWPELLGDG